MGGGRCCSSIACAPVKFRSRFLCSRDGTVVHRKRKWRGRDPGSRNCCGEVFLECNDDAESLGDVDLSVKFYAVGEEVTRSLALFFGIAAITFVNLQTRSS